MMIEGPSLPAKFNAIVAIAKRWEPEAYVVMEDDDVYLPRHVSSHAAVLETAEYSKPSVVLSDYPGHLVEEPAEGHVTSCLRRHTRSDRLHRGDF